MDKLTVSLHGVVGEFTTPETLLEAAHKAAAEGYTHAEAYTPNPVDGLAEALGFHWTPVGLMTLVAGVLGGLTGFGMCWYANVINYPLNIGGRPHNSWPAWIPITFELTVLFAALTAAFGMLCMNGLPQLHHPIFNAPHFDTASHDRFFLCIEARDPRFESAKVQTFLRGAGAVHVSEVPA